MRTQFNDAKWTKNVYIRKTNVLWLMKAFKTHIKKGNTNYRCAFPIGIKVVNLCQCCKIPYLFWFFFTNKFSRCIVFYNFIDPINIVLKHQISYPRGNGIWQGIGRFCVMLITFNSRCHWWHTNCHRKNHQKVKSPFHQLLFIYKSNGHINNWRLKNEISWYVHGAT